MTHTISTNPTRTRYFVAGPVKGKDKPMWMIVDTNALGAIVEDGEPFRRSKVVEYVEGRDEAVRRCEELNGDA